MAQALRNIPVGNTRRGSNIRDECGPDIMELASSIAEFGILSPLSVRPTRDGRFEVVTGHRRLAAARLAGLESVPCTVMTDELDDGDVVLAQFTENIQRKDISAWEVAGVIRGLKARHRMTSAEIGRRIGGPKHGLTCSSWRRASWRRSTAGASPSRRGERPRQRL